VFNVEQGIHDVVSVAARALPNTYGAVERCYVYYCCARAAAVLPQEAKSEIASQARMALLMPRSSAAAAARPRADVIIHVKAKDGFKEVGKLADRASCVRVATAACVNLTLAWMREQLASKLQVVRYIGRRAAVDVVRVKLSCVPVCLWPVFVLQVTANGHLDEVQELAKLSSSGERPCT
jgi:hypothetical protein